MIVDWAMGAVQPPVQSAILTRRPRSTIRRSAICNPQSATRRTPGALLDVMEMIEGSPIDAVIPSDSLPLD
jgi:hypothetical protein